MPSASSHEFPSSSSASTSSSSRSVHDELIPVARVARVLKLHPATVRAMYRRGDFPPPINIGARKVVFSRYALDAWFRERLGGQSPDARFPLVPDVP